jgi:hypothetical protein
MQELGLGRGFRRDSDGYDNGDVGSPSPARGREQVRSRRLGEVRKPERWSRGTAWLTAISTPAGDDLLE